MADYPCHSSKRPPRRSMLPTFASRSPKRPAMTCGRHLDALDRPTVSSPTWSVRGRSWNCNGTRFPAGVEVVRKAHFRPIVAFVHDWRSSSLRYCGRSSTISRVGQKGMENRLDSCCTDRGYFLSQIVWRANPRSGPAGGGFGRAMTVLQVATSTALGALGETSFVPHTAVAPTLRSWH